MISIKAPETRPCSIPHHHLYIPTNNYEANCLMIIAALTEGRNVIHRLPFNEDTQTVVNFLSSQDNYQYEMSYRRKEESEYSLVLHKLNKITNHLVYARRNHDFTMFIAPMLLLYAKKFWFFNKGFTLDSDANMRERSMGELFLAMKSLGAKIKYQETHKYLPVRIKGSYIGGECKLPGHTNQSFSALLLSAPYAEKDVIIHATSPIIGLSYINTTIQCMRECGAKVEKLKSKHGSFRVVGGRKKVYHPFKKTLKIDPTVTTFFMALVALNYTHLHVYGFNRRSPQGESKFYKVLEKIGCKVKMTHLNGECVLLLSPPIKRYTSSITINMANMLDALPIMICLAVILADKHRMMIYIKGVPILKYGDNSNVELICKELLKINASIDIKNEIIVITPTPLKLSKVPLDSFGDHRLVMAFSLLSLAVREVGIMDDGCVEKSFPHFFDKLKKLDFICNKINDF